MTSAKAVVALWLIALLAGCEEPPEYRVLEDGTQWKLAAFGEAGTERDSVQWMRLDADVVRIANGDTVAAYRARPFAESDDEVWRLLAARTIGDSLIIRFSSPNFLSDQAAPGDTLEAHVAVRGLRTAARLRDERFAELDRLDSLLRTDSVAAAFKEYRGVWFREIHGGDTLKVRPGKEIVIHYQGRTLEGRVFDDSRALDGAFRFVYGNEGQVLAGIETALLRMHRGDVAEVIIPSYAAFGSKGSADGRVGPYTTVVYRVEVMDVARW
ncbi:MAG: FKBP-type peptidyl-prolyl cis-trans isomerase [Flavobacteriales bacterium]|nr:FKBP-type peptidyl-prolyl cis-trans isomerase [Flavobacteriales bacterium]